MTLKLSVIAAVVVWFLSWAWMIGGDIFRDVNVVGVLLVYALMTLPYGVPLIASLAFGAHVARRRATHPLSRVAIYLAVGFVLSGAAFLLLSVVLPNAAFSGDPRGVIGMAPQIGLTAATFVPVLFRR